jgi:transcriptional regulator with XRE-family HTH domain
VTTLTLPPMESLGKRVEYKRLKLGMSQKDLAEIVGMTQQGIDAIEKGGSKQPRKIRELARALQTTQEWLLGEDDLERVPDDMPPPDFAYSPAGAAAFDYDKIVYTPDVDGAVPEIDVRAGAGEGAVGHVFPLKNDDVYTGHEVIGEWLFPTSFLKNELKARRSGVFVLEVQGDSMRPTLEPGDRVIIDKSQNLFGPDSVIYCITLNGYEYPQVKRIERAWEEHEPMFRIISDNPASKVSTVPASRIRFIGRVVGRISRL